MVKIDVVLSTDIYSVVQHDFLYYLFEDPIVNEDYIKLVNYGINVSNVFILLDCNKIIGEPKDVAALLAKVVNNYDKSIRMRRAYNKNFIKHF